LSSSRLRMSACATAGILASASLTSTGSDSKSLPMNSLACLEVLRSASGSEAMQCLDLGENRALTAVAVRRKPILQYSRTNLRRRVEAPLTVLTPRSTVARSGSSMASFRPMKSFPWRVKWRASGRSGALLASQLGGNTSALMPARNRPEALPPAAGRSLAPPYRGQVKAGVSWLRSATELLPNTLCWRRTKPVFQEIQEPFVFVGFCRLLHSAYRHGSRIRAHSGQYLHLPASSQHHSNSCCVWVYRHEQDIALPNDVHIGLLRIIPLLVEVDQSQFFVRRTNHISILHQDIKHSGENRIRGNGNCSNLDIANPCRFLRSWCWRRMNLNWRHATSHPTDRDHSNEGFHMLRHVHRPRNRLVGPMQISLWLDAPRRAAKNNEHAQGRR